MGRTFSVPLSKVIKEQGLTPVFLPRDAQEINIETVEINRPGLQLAGFYEFFDSQRLQVIGKSEHTYLEQLEEKKLAQRFDEFFSLRPCVVIMARGLPIHPEMQACAERYSVPLLCSDMGTSELVATLIAMLNVELAPRVTRHGVLVEVHGEGILLLGESGVGKSETAVELVKRGHRLIADDAVEIRRVSANTLVGTSPENIRHFIELRGVGIVNIRRIFGIGSVKMTEKIDMIIQLEQWDNQKVYDRMGLDNEYMEILGNRVPSLTIPVKPGRNLAIIIEIAAMNNRQKKMGYNAAHELLVKLGMAHDIEETLGQ